MCEIQLCCFFFVAIQLSEFGDLVDVDVNLFAFIPKLSRVWIREHNLWLSADGSVFKLL